MVLGVSCMMCLSYDNAQLRLLVSAATPRTADEVSLEKCHSNCLRLIINRSLKGRYGQQQFKKLFPSPNSAIVKIPFSVKCAVLWATLLISSSKAC